MCLLISICPKNLKNGYSKMPPNYTTLLETSPESVFCIKFSFRYIFALLFNRPSKFDFYFFKVIITILNVICNNQAKTTEPIGLVFAQR